MLFFDYLYYRVATAYFKREGRNSITAVLALSMFQVLIIADLSILITRFFWDRQHTSSYSGHASFIGVLLLFCLVILNFRKYKNKYHSLKSRWKEESRERYILNGFMVIIALSVPWIILIVLGVKQ